MNINIKYKLAGQILKQERKNKGFSLSKVASELNRVSDDLIKKIESGKNHITEKKFTLEDIKKIYSLSDEKYKKLCILYDKKDFQLLEIEQNLFIYETLIKDLLSLTNETKIKDDKEELETFIKKGQNIFKNSIHRFNSYLMTISLLDKNYEEANKIAEKSIEDYEEANKIAEKSIEEHFNSILSENDVPEKKMLRSYYFNSANSLHIEASSLYSENQSLLIGIQNTFLLNRNFDSELITQYSNKVNTIKDLYYKAIQNTELALKIDNYQKGQHQLAKLYFDLSELERNYIDELKLPTSNNLSPLREEYLRKSLEYFTFLNITYDPNYPEDKKKDIQSWLALIYAKLGKGEYVNFSLNLINGITNSHPTLKSALQIKAIIYSLLEKEIKEIEVIIENIEETFYITKEFIKNIMDEGLNENVVKIFKSYLDEKFTKNQFKLELNKLDISDEMKCLISKYALCKVDINDIYNDPDMFYYKKAVIQKHGIEYFKRRFHIEG